MPVIYLEPMFGLANRLIMIISAIRFAQAVGHELEVIWHNELVGFGSNPHFAGPLDQFFPDLARFSSRRPENISLFFPKSLAPFRTVYDPRTFLHTDVFISGWTHFILLPHDFEEGAGRLLTKDLRDIANKRLLNGFRLNSQSSDLRLVSDFLLAESLRGFDLGIHIRTDKFISTTDRDDPSFLSRELTESDFYELIRKYTVDASRPLRIFVCGVSSVSIEGVSNIALQFGHSVFSLPHAIRESAISIEASSLYNSISVVSDFAQCLDFVLLSRCNLVVTWAPSTFGGLASLVAGKGRVVKMNNQLQLIGSDVFSGLGL